MKEPRNINLIPLVTTKNISIEQKTKDAGFRNFTSFVFICYHGQGIRLSLKKCSQMLGVSSSKFRSSLVKRGWPPVTSKKNPSVMLKKRKLYIWAIVKEKTSFIFPWCAIYIFYVKYGMTTYEIASILGVSQFYVLKLMDEYGIERRKKGGEGERRWREKKYIGLPEKIAEAIRYR